MFWRIVEWFLRVTGDPGKKFFPGDEMDNAPEPDGNDQDAEHGVPS
jgi:hypothetical protein